MMHSKTFQIWISHFPGLSFHLIELPETKQTIKWYNPEVLQGKLEILFPFFEYQLSVLPGAWSPIAYGTSEVLSDRLFEILKSCEGNSILEVGCGIGTHCIRFAELGFDLVGLDISHVAIKSALINRTKYSEGVLQLLCGKTEHQFRKRLITGQKADIIIFHGMRQVFKPSALEMLTSLGAGTVILMSPGLRAFGINYHQLDTLGWRCESIFLADQIPHTTGILSAAVFKHEGHLRS